MITNWVRALQSGKYTQGVSTINKEKRTLCALGVLAVEEGYLRLDDQFNIIEYRHRDFANLINELLGIELVLEIVVANDRGIKTFNEIGELLLERFKIKKVA
jgi:hypothetical protein